VRDDNVYLQHIAESIDLIADYLAGLDGNLEERLFYDDLRTQDAVLRRMKRSPMLPAIYPIHSKLVIPRFRGGRSLPSAMSSRMDTPTFALTEFGRLSRVICRS
jgi:hypothetical protein